MFDCNGLITDCHGACPSLPQTAAAGVVAWGEAEAPTEAEAGGDGTAQAQALFLLQQKEKDLQQMRDYTSQLASRQ